MTMTDVPPPNTARVLVDGEFQFNKTKVPVLISPGNRRLVVLQSQALYDMQIGLGGTLLSDERGNHDIVIADIDRLALVVRYEYKTPADDFELPSPE
jgi:hypothetical protein